MRWRPRPRTPPQPASPPPAETLGERMARERAGAVQALTTPAPPPRPTLPHTGHKTSVRSRRRAYDEEGSRSGPGLGRPCFPSRRTPSSSLPSPGAIQMQRNAKEGPKNREKLKRRDERENTRLETGAQSAGKKVDAIACEGMLGASMLIVEGEEGEVLTSRTCARETTTGDRDAG
ncbi:hypothetical protein BC628DRAFT_1358261, partial [Trametes gibbosa]